MGELEYGFIMDKSSCDKRLVSGDEDSGAVCNFNEGDHGGVVEVGL